MAKSTNTVHLRAVTPDERVKVERKPMTVSEALDSGDELDLKLAERRVVAKRIDDEKTSAREIAALTKRMSELSQDIKALQAAEGAGEVEGSTTAEADDSFDASAL